MFIDKTWGALFRGLPVALFFAGMTSIAFAELTCVEGNCVDGFGKAVGPGNHPSLRSMMYEGEWRNGKFHGKGKFTWDIVNSLNQTYEGTYNNGKRNGFGITMFSDNSQEYGWYLEDKYQGDNVCIEGDCENGIGTKASFWGKELYTGEFYNGKRHGNGAYLGAGSTYSGEFARDQFNGQGKLADEDGNLYEGGWLHSKKHGQGRLVYANGRVEEGIWENDALVLTQTEVDFLAHNMGSRKAECTSFGYEAGSDAHADCVMKLAITERNRLKDKRIAAREAKEQAESDARWAAYKRGLRATAERKRDAAYAALEAENAAFEAAAAREEGRQRQANALINLGSAISSGGSPPPTVKLADPPLKSGRFKTCRYRVSGEIVSITVGRSETCSANRNIGGRLGFLVR